MGKGKGGERGRIGKREGKGRGKMGKGKKGRGREVRGGRRAEREREEGRLRAEEPGVKRGREMGRGR